VTARISGVLFKGFNGPVQINPEDHQLQKGVFVSRWQKVNAEYPVAAEETDFTFAPIQYFEAGKLSGNSSCQMRRP
jgi:branched-chain amino acid transport system substrate-binding protein